MTPLHVEAVTVCVGYGDFLRQTIKYNISQVDKLVIVTSPEDEETREVCRRHGVQTLLTNEQNKHKAVFNKGLIVERGLQHLSQDSWRLHLDADIILPYNFKNSLNSANLDENKIYGCDRILIKGWNEYQKFINSGFLFKDYHCRVNFPKDIPVGTRWATDTTGYVPIGFFQLWHSQADLYKGARIKPYPSEHNDACRTDVQHALQWDRRDRELLPEVVVIHLESEDAPLGVNWKGRKTKRFGPPVQDPKPSCKPPS